MLYISADINCQCDFQNSAAIESKNPISIWRSACQDGRLEIERLISPFLSYCEQLKQIHLIGKVAKINGLQQFYIEAGQLKFHDLEGIDSTSSLKTIDSLFRPDSALKFRLLNDGSSELSGEPAQNDEPDLRSEQPEPAYLAAYDCYEPALGHHDPLTDLFILGLYLTSALIGTDFTDQNELDDYVFKRRELRYGRSQLHPALRKLLFELCAINRDSRPRDVDEVLFVLKNYRELPLDTFDELTQQARFQKEPSQSLSAYINSRLKNRLFDLTRRNKLLWFKPTKSTLNITACEILLRAFRYGKEERGVLSKEELNQVKQIDPLSWNTSSIESLQDGRPINLLSTGQNEVATELFKRLNKIRLQSNREWQEYGYRSLRIVSAFLHWFDLEEPESGRISSPLLLLPASLTRLAQPGKPFQLRTVADEFEVNPTLRYKLHEQHGIELPAFMPIEEQTLSKLFEMLQRQLHAAHLETDMQIKLNLELEVERLELPTDDIEPSNTEKQQQNEDEARYRLSTNIDWRPLQTEEKNWMIDASTMVIANLSFRSMSLVEDYQKAIETDQTFESFNRLFDGGTEHQSARNAQVEAFRNFQIVPTDPSQAKCVQRVKSGESFVIQGPPGTGKTQTITNLIADALAESKKVLFVCEKRVALDLVYQKLRSTGLDQLCSLIHDSQEDKRPFINDLSRIYNEFQRESFLEETQRKREDLIFAAETELRLITQYEQFLTQTDSTNKIALSQLINEAIERGIGQAEIEDAQELPSFHSWIQVKTAYERLNHRIERYFGGTGSTKKPFSYLKLEKKSSQISFKDYFDRLEACLRLIHTFFEQQEGKSYRSLSIGQFFHTIEQINSLEDILLSGRQSLLLPDSSERAELEQLADHIETSERELDAARTLNKHWKQPFLPSETDLALEQLTDFEASLFRFFRPAYYRLIRAIKRSYDFNAHQLQPSLRVVLENLQQQHKIEANLKRDQHSFLSKFALGKPKHVQRRLLLLDSKLAPETLACITGEHQKRSWNTADFKQILNLLSSWKSLTSLIEIDEQLSLHDALAELEKMKGELKDLPSFSEELNAFIQAEQSIWNFLKNCWLSSDQIDEKLLRSDIERSFRRNVRIADTMNGGLRLQISKLKLYQELLLKTNAQLIREKQMARFKEIIDCANRSHAGSSAEEKLSRKRLNDGQRILKNEFKKSRRHKSIRELLSGDAAEIVREMKPVWLMSPLSVSDTLPLEEECFDLVIFDEASQISLERGVPSLFRAKQFIVVGDEMQMPPSRFFMSTANDDEQDEASIYEDFPLDADSILNQALRSLKCETLQWHYRSRSSSLISFSNHAFYAGQLKTLPDRQSLAEHLSEIHVHSVSDAQVNSSALFDRPVSFHFMKKGVYNKRMNLPEAEYIAQLLMSVLKRQNCPSIGIVGFNLQQQDAIEEAIEQLAESDDEFAEALTRSGKSVNYEAEPLFIKNLENVQGDERDIIIVSFAYAKDFAGKFSMNFGPVNRRDGERRLNVLFSRAKEHLAVVSSVRHTDFRFSHNRGANLLRLYLKFAELMSSGKSKLANAVFRSEYKQNQNGFDMEPFKSAMIAEISDLGYSTDLHRGDEGIQSFIKLSDESAATKYSTALFDDSSETELEVYEQYVRQPVLLESFGWNRAHASIISFYRNSEEFITRVKNSLLGVGEKAEDVQLLEQIRVKYESTTASGSVAAEHDQPLFVQLIKPGSKTANFWMIARKENELIIRYGRVGSAGRKLIKQFGTGLAAELEKEKLVRKKMSEGYSPKNPII